MRPFCPNFHANLLTTTPTEVTSSVCADTIGKSCENQFLSLFAYENYKKRLQLIFPETISKHKPYLVAWSVSRGNPPGHLPSATQTTTSFFPASWDKSPLKIIFFFVTNLYLFTSSLILGCRWALQGCKTASALSALFLI